MLPRPSFSPWFVWMPVLCRHLHGRLASMDSTHRQHAASDSATSLSHMVRERGGEEQPQGAESTAGMLADGLSMGMQHAEAAGGGGCRTFARRSRQHGSSDWRSCLQRGREQGIWIAGDARLCWRVERQWGYAGRGQVFQEEASGLADRVVGERCPRLGRCSCCHWSPLCHVAPLHCGRMQSMLGQANLE